MAYTTSDLRDAAREYARAGGNITKTVAALRADPGLEKFSEATLRRMMFRPEWAGIVAEQTTLLLDAERSAAVEVERERARREMQGTVLDKLAGDELMLDQARVRLVEALNDVNLKPSQKLQAFDMLAKIIDRRKDKVLIAIGTERQAQLFVESIQEATYAVATPGLAKQIFDRAKEIYNARSKEEVSDEHA